VERTDLRADVPGGSLGGWETHSHPPHGLPVLLLHGGPGLSYEYLDALADEIGDGYRIAAFQQRGLPPSTVSGPFDIATAVTDAVAVLDALGWDRAWVIGHSWGGHLLLHLATAVPERLHGGVAVDPLGGVGDGGAAAFEAELAARTPKADRDRAFELDEQAMRGEGTEEHIRESLRLLWPAYFASREHTMPLPVYRASLEAYSGLWESVAAELPRLEAALAGIALPFAVLAGAQSPLPADQAAGATARAIPGARLDIVEGAGHFPWFEHPGCVRAGLERLVSRGRTSTAAG
jgi:proline iminopeptidase